MAEATQRTAAFEVPREIANKSDRSHLLRAIRMALDIQSPAIRQNTQVFNAGRYRATAILPDYEALKDEARRIKEKSIANLPGLIQQLKGAVRARGGHFFVATTGAEASRHVLEICRRRAAKLIVKGKSITSEEIRLNPVLEAEGMEVVESDLAEFILQVADEQPSHIIAPAIHYSRERITALFKRKFKTDLPLDSCEALVKFAREKLRDKFLYADVGITGGNLLAADSGTLMLVESEGNIRMASFLPPVHIAIVGIEKIVPTRREMAPFLELLARSATGQSLSSYTSFLCPPLEDPVFALPGKAMKPREFHLVLIDNGRLRMSEDTVLNEALYCIRCSACLNSCANFQTVGGHAFGGETYSGGIGGAWEAGTGKLTNARFSELCTGCTRCVNQCPVRIDIPWLNANLGSRLNHTVESTALSAALGAFSGAATEDRKISASKIFFGNYHYFAKWGARLARLPGAAGRSKGPAPAGFSDSLANAKPLRMVMERWVGLDHRRQLPAFSRQTLVQAARKVLPNAGLAAVTKAPLVTKGAEAKPSSDTKPQPTSKASEVKTSQNAKAPETKAVPDTKVSTETKASATAKAPEVKATPEKVVVFADVFTNYGMVHRGLATIELLRALGVDVVVSETVPDGRAALSQGMIATAREHARRTTAALDKYLSEGRDIVVVEPSSLAMFRRDFRHLLDSAERFERFCSRSYDPVEYVVKLLAKTKRKPLDVFDAARSPVGQKLFFHGHCQQKTVGAADPTETLLRHIGFDVEVSKVECCGMAGSFGYKKDFYELSMAVGADLFAQVTEGEREAGPRALIAAGTSCTEQLQAGMGRQALHPIELLGMILKG
jgi:iron-sulfur cluster protein